MKSNKKLNKALVAALVTSAVFGVNTTAHAASETNLNSNTESTTNVESKAEDSETYEVVDIEEATNEKHQNQDGANSGLSIPKTEDVGTKEYKDGTVEKKETESTNKDNTSEDKKEDTKENNQKNIYSDIKNKGESIEADSYESNAEVSKNKLPEVLKEGIKEKTEVRRDYSEISVPDVDIYKYSKKTDKTGKTIKTSNEPINTLFKVTADDTGESHIVYTDMYGRLQNINYLPFGRVSNIEIDDLDLKLKDANGDSKISDILSLDNGLNLFNPFVGDKNIQELDRDDLEYDPSKNEQIDRYLGGPIYGSGYDGDQKPEIKYVIDDIKNLKDDDYVLGGKRLGIQNPENQYEDSYIVKKDGTLRLFNLDPDVKGNDGKVIYKAEDIYGNDNIKAKNGIYNMDDVNINSVVNFGMKKKDYVNALERAKVHRMLRVFLPNIGEQIRTQEEAEALIANKEYIKVLKQEYGDNFVNEKTTIQAIPKNDLKVYTNLAKKSFMRQRILDRLMYKQKNNNFTIEEQDLKGIETLSDLNPFIAKVNKNLTYRDLLGLNLITYTDPASKTYTFEELRTNTNYGKSLAKFQLQANPNIDMGDYAKKYANKLEVPSCNYGGYEYGSGSSGSGRGGSSTSHGSGKSGYGSGSSSYGSGKPSSIDKNEKSNVSALMSFMTMRNASTTSSQPTSSTVGAYKHYSSKPGPLSGGGFVVEEKNNLDVCRVAPPKATFSLVNLRNGQKIVKNEDSGYFHVINEDMVVNTKAYDKADNDQIITPSKKSVIVDEINVDKFDANKSYKLVGKIVDENGNDIADFQPKDIELKDILKKNEKTGYAEGKLTVEYELDTSNFEDGSKYVLVYDIYEKDINDKEGVYVQTGDHFNLSDKAQTFIVKKDPTCPVPDISIPWYPLTPADEEKEDKDNSIPWYPLTPTEKEEDTCKKVSIPMVNLIPAEKVEEKIDGGTPEKDCEDKSIPWYPLVPAEAKEIKNEDDKDNNKVEITEKQDKNDVIKETPTNNTNDTNRKRAPQTGVTGISGYVVSALLSSVGLGITKKKRK